MSDRDRTKARIKTLEMALSAVTVASRARDPYEKLAAAELAVEFNERIEALRREDKEPALALGHSEG